MPLQPLQTVGDLRRATAGLPDDAPIYYAYNEVADKYIFVRIDGITTERPPHGLSQPTDPAGLHIVMSTVGADDIEDGGDDDEPVDNSYVVEADDPAQQRRGLTDEEVRRLQPGDDVFWNDPDGGLCSQVYSIAAIEISGEGADAVVRITDPDGGVLECFARELS
jgi:hypothetical protein